MASVTQQRMDELLSATKIDGITMGELVEVYLFRYKEVNKITSYEELKSILKNYYMPYVDPSRKVSDLNFYDFARLKKGIAESTIQNKNMVIAYAKLLFRFCESYYNFRCLPAFRMNKIRKTYDPSFVRKEYYIYDFKAFKKFMAKVDSIFDRCLFYSLYYLGLRLGEIRGLKWSDIGSGGILSINRAVTSNTGIGKSLEIDCKSKSSYRYFRLPAFMASSFKSLHDSAPDTVYIFQETKRVRMFTGMAVSESSIKRHIRRQAEIAHLPYLHPHGWRHSCASFLVNQMGCSIYQVKEWLGHSSIDVTSRIYVHLFPEAKDAITKGLEYQNDSISHGFYKTKKKASNNKQAYLNN